MQGERSPKAREIGYIKLNLRIFALSCNRRVRIPDNLLLAHRCVSPRRARAGSGKIRPTHPVNFAGPAPPDPFAGANPHAVFPLTNSDTIISVRKPSGIDMIPGFCSGIIA